jgi:tubulin-specific chaperone A
VVFELSGTVPLVSRLHKEVDYYRREVLENEARLQTMKKEGKDPYDIKKYKEVLGESQMMIPDSERRLQASLEDLSLFLDTNNSLDDSEYLTQARELLQNSSEDRKSVETHVDDDSDTF